MLNIWKRTVRFMARNNSWLGEAGSNWHLKSKRRVPRETGTKGSMLLDGTLYLRQSARRGRSRVNTDLVIHCGLRATFHHTRLQRETNSTRIRRRKLVSPSFFSSPRAVREDLARSPKWWFIQSFVQCTNMKVCSVLVKLPIFSRCYEHFDSF